MNRCRKKFDEPVREDENVACPKTRVVLIFVHKWQMSPCCRCPGRMHKIRWVDETRNLPKILSIGLQSGSYDPVSGPRVQNCGEHHRYESPDIPDPSEQRPASPPVRFRLFAQKRVLSILSERFAAGSPAQQHPEPFPDSSTGLPPVSGYIPTPKRAN